MKIPKYRKHSTRNLGFVEVNKKRYYFKGAYNSSQSLKEYAEFIQDIAKSKQEFPSDIRSTRGDDIPIRYLTAKFLDWAKNNYKKKSGRSTGTYEQFRDYIVPPLVDMFGGLPTCLFGPIDLRKLREVFVSQGLCRNTVNMRTTKVKRIFSWGAGNELVPESVAGALGYVEMLEQGKTTAPETEPVVSVSDTIIEKTLPFLPQTVSDMVLLQRELGCRPSEVCNVRWCDIDQSDDIWIYEPFESKMEHKKKRRLIAFRKIAQTILEKYRYRPEEEFVFSPRETMRKKYESKIKNSKKLEKKIARHSNKYSTNAYDNVIECAAAKAGVQHWSPNQIRHRFATNTDRDVSREAAMIALGHTKQSTTAIYIDEDAEKIKMVARMLDNQPQ